MTYARPDLLITPDALARGLDDPALRVLDCTVYINPSGVESGRDHWERGHIPGSRFIDLAGELSDPDSPYRFTMPSPDRAAAALALAGVGEGTRVVCYDANMTMWAARVWWMLRALGFDDAAVLDGGWKRWKLEGRPISTESCAYPPARFLARPRPELFASKHDVLAAVSAGHSCIVNALTPEQHRGEGVSYGRPGRIASSVNVSAIAMLDRETGALLPADELRSRFASVGATSGGRVITYCGGGIAASSAAFVLTLLGVDNVAVYDGSLAEWSRDPSLPMETG